MNARDELIADLSRPEHAPMSDHDPRDGSCRSCPVPVWSLGAADIADALIAEGWRKMPSRDDVARWVWKRRIGPNGNESFDYLIAREARGLDGLPEGIWAEADAILALMDMGK